VKSIEHQIGIWVHCPNASCAYTWRYSGRFFLYATCPSCRRNVKIQDNKVISPQSVQVGSPSQIAAVKDTPAKELLHDNE
jgi:hypothetical protein